MLSPCFIFPCFHLHHVAPQASTLAFSTIGMSFAFLKFLASNYTREFFCSSTSLHQTLFNHGTSPASWKISLQLITLGILGNHKSHAIHSSNSGMPSVFLKNSLAHIAVPFTVSSTPPHVEIFLPQLSNAYSQYAFYLETAPQRLITSILTNKITPIVVNSLKITPIKYLMS